MQGAELELHIILWGRVQGVSLRKNVMKYAKVLGLTGYVKNQADGSVLIVAQGSQSQLEELLLWSQKAVFPARVTGMSYEWRAPEKRYMMFLIDKQISLVKDQASSMYNLGKEVLKVDRKRVPRHVVILADGNRRWARSRGWKPWVGHREASKFERIRPVIRECMRLGIPYLSYWVWSTENWDRSEDERLAIFDIFRVGVDRAVAEFKKDGVRFRHIGRKDRLPSDIVQGLLKLESETKKGTKLQVQLCMDYGGRDEIVRAVNAIIKDRVGEMTEKIFSNYLDTVGIPDPDLIIRTSGEKRTSGFMPYQAAYSELYFTNVPFPDFNADEFRRAILEYSSRIRRFGGTVEEDLRKINVASLKDPGRGCAET